MKVGILDIQGSVEEHFAALAAMNDVEPVLVKKTSDMGDVEALILPGGESTVIGDLMSRFGLRDVILERIQAGMPIMGTCAGAILLAKEIRGEGSEKVNGLGVIDIVVERNSYGRQVESFEAEVEFCGKNVEGVFIRAPRIVSVGEGVEVLGKYGDEIVAVRQGKIMALSFHPEMGRGEEIYEEFLNFA